FSAPHAMLISLYVFVFFYFFRRPPRPPPPFPTRPPSDLMLPPTSMRVPVRLTAPPVPAVLLAVVGAEPIAVIAFVVSTPPAVSVTAPALRPWVLPRSEERRVGNAGGFRGPASAGQTEPGLAF